MDDRTKALVRNRLLTCRSHIIITQESGFGICSDYNSPNGCKNSDCSDLHCCLHYLQKACKFNIKCRFSHDIKNIHNFPILRKNRAEHLDLDELLEILNAKHMVPTRPLICKGYNSSGGCKFGSECTCLHLCGFYITDECSYGRNCKRSHDLKDSKVRDVLEKRGINVKQSCKEILNEIRKRTGAQQNNEKKRAKSCDKSSSVTKLSISEQKQDNEKFADDSQLICTFYLRNKCFFKENCTKFHQPDHLPYHWQYRNKGGMWMDLPLNRDIEKCYCHCKDFFTTFLDSIVQLNLDLNNMTWTDLDGNNGKIRRLSTELQKDASREMLFLTVWKWYWMKDDTKQWFDYQAKDNYPGSEQIEAVFLENPRTPFQFKSNRWLYKIDFERMMQINQSTKKVRRVMRRPDFFDEKSKRPKSIAISMETEENKSIAINFPNFWKLASADAKGDSYLIVDVSKTSDEYLRIDILFRQTAQRPIKTLKRVENSELWRFFAMKGDSLKKKGDSYSTEKYLFHGTRDKYVEAICRQGFDFRLSGMSSGTSYGKGSYFARDASYSLRYSDCSKMFLARVIVGEFVKGLPSYTRPPLRDAVKYDHYESCVNNEVDPSIFVIFDNIQAYPEYLVEY